MTNHLLDFADEAVNLHVSLDRLRVTRDSTELALIPLAEIAAVVLTHPQIAVSHATLAGLAAHGAACIVTDTRYLPIGMLLPLQGHFIQAERFAQQANATGPMRKRSWQALIRAKIAAQSAVLKTLHGEDAGLATMVARVKSGDPDNQEAQAARRYWTRLFRDDTFRRDRERPDQNRHLNYGYAILRAIVARALCAAGLHPSLGLHHHNRYNPFCLADDVMEPFRPLVDIQVARWLQQGGEAEAPLDREAKAFLIQHLTGRLPFEGEWRTLFDLLGSVSYSLTQVYAGERLRLLLPEVADAIQATAA